ncbi:hypothetical protein TWF281_009318 [Arthrobotrys megalospora]
MATCYVRRRTGCYVCGSNFNLFACDRCLAIEYCGKDHQKHAQNSGLHTAECDAIHGARRDFQSATDAFKSFYGIDETELPNILSDSTVMSQYSNPHAIEYLNSLNLLAEVLIKLGSPAALRLAYEHVLEMHILDDMNSGLLESFMTAVLLFQGEDQLCFQYITFSQNTIHDDDYNDDDDMGPDYWSDHKETLLAGFSNQPSVLKQLSIPMDPYEGLTPKLGFPLLLIFFRWMEDLKNLENFRNVELHLTGRLNFDIARIIEKAIPQTDLVRKQFKTILRADIPELIKKLQARIEYTFLLVCMEESYIWHQLLESIENREITEPAVTPPTEVGDERNRASERRAVQLLWRSWAEIPSAVKYVREILPRAEKQIEGVQCRDTSWEAARDSDIALDALFYPLAKAGVWTFGNDV